MNELDPNNLDKGVLKVMKTIRQLESAGDYEAVGDNGSSYGAFQWNNDGKPLAKGELPANWKRQAKEIIGDENAPMTKENQNKVAYGKMLQYKQQGRQPEEIDALWNGASKDASGRYVHNNPQRGEDFRNLITQQMPSQATMGTGYVTSVPVAQATPEEQAQAKAKSEELFPKLKGRAEDISTAAKETIARQINPLSGFIQAGGAVAGAGGDLLDKIIKSTPIVGGVVKGIEGVIGDAVGSFMQTQTGQDIAKMSQDFAKAHPELSKDIGAGINIISAIPILKGLGKVASVGLDATAQKLKSTVQNAYKEGLAKSLTNKTSQKILKQNPEGLNAIVENNAIADVENGKYVTKEAYQKLAENVEAVDDELDALLTSATGKGALPTVNLQSLRNQALAQAEKNLIGQSNYRAVVNKINDLFDDAMSAEQTVKIGGEPLMKLDDANFFKRQARKGLQWDDTVGNEAGFYVGQAYMKGIEDIATKAGLGDVREINQRLGKLLQGQNVLNDLNGKKVVTSEIGKKTQTVMTAGGAGVGTMAGVSPEVSAWLANRAGGILRGNIEQFAPNILRRAEQSVGKSKKKQLFKGVVGNVKLNPLKQEGILRGLAQQQAVSKSSEKK